MKLQDLFEDHSSPVEAEYLKQAVANLNKITDKFGISADFVFIPANVQHKMKSVGWQRISTKDVGRDGMNFPNAIPAGKLSLHAEMSSGTTMKTELYLVAKKRSRLDLDLVAEANKHLVEICPFDSNRHLFIRKNSLALDCGYIDLYYKDEYVKYLSKALAYVSTLPITW